MSFFGTGWINYACCEIFLYQYSVLLFSHSSPVCSTSLVVHRSLSAAATMLEKPTSRFATSVMPGKANQETGSPVREVSGRGLGAAALATGEPV